MKLQLKIIIFIFFNLPLIFLLVGPVFASDITTSWNSGLPLPYSDASMVSFSRSNKIFVIGGSASTGNSHNEIIDSTVDSTTGVLSPWLVHSTFPTALLYHSIAEKDNFIYVLGGREENPGSSLNFVNKVFVGEADQSGDVSNWIQTSPLPERIGMGAAAIINNRIYFAGGYKNYTQSKLVYSAPINPDGTLGDWIESGVMPNASYGLSMVSYSGHLIIIGGYGGIDGDYLSSVYTGTPDADGKISSWVQDSSFPYHVYRASAIMVGSQIIVAGAALPACDNCYGVVSSRNVYYADVADDGTISFWTLSANLLPSPVHAASMTRVGDYLYLIGGYDNNFSNGYLRYVYYTKLNLETSLDVPLLKQTDPQWEGDLYDSANLWASPGNQDISQWGCALTSAAMVFQYNRITKMPDGGDLNPESLNNWLKSQPDGYVNNGWVNWLALSRLSKIAKIQNPLFNFDALEYSRSSGFDPSTVTSDLKNNIPVILEEPGHFIVAKGTSGNSFLINDPYYTKTLLSDYADSALAMGMYSPSNTDLSYIMFVADNGVTVSVKDSNGNILGEGFTQQPIDEDGASAKSGSPKYFYYVPKPSVGDYTVLISSNTTKQYTLQSFLYDVNGNVKEDSGVGIIGGNTKDSFTVNFNKDSLNKTDILENYSFDSLISDLDLLYSQKLITNLGVYKAMRGEAVQAQKSSSKIKIMARALMNSLYIILRTNHNRTIKDAAYKILEPEVSFLIKSIK